jgi:GR25 family glycosyltransferase involved in LPS biosynthesis
VERFRKVTDQFRNKGVKYERFNAVDGRCKKGECAQKKREMEKKYGVKISNTVKAPTASLVIGTLEILKRQVKNKWKRVLICEDDVVFDPKILQTFEKGINELGNEDWDLLYLGCGGTCGSKGISNTKTKNEKYLTSLSIVDKHEYDWYVKHPDDLRVPLYEDDMDRSKWGKYISIPMSPGGCWAYCYSLKGAKKALDMFKNKINNHIDQLLINKVSKNKLKAYSFDPPIIWHEKGAFRPDSDLPWTW